MNLILRSTFINIGSILIYLLPIVLLTGPFLPDLFISIIGLIFLSITINERKWAYYRNNFFYFFISAYFYLLASSLISEHSSLSLESSLFYFRFILFALGTWFLIDNNKNLIKFFTISLLLTFILCIFDGSYQFYHSGQFESNLFGYQNISPDRMTLVFNDKQLLGGYLARLLPLLFAVCIYSFPTNKKNLIIPAAILIACDVITYGTGERTAIVLLFIATLSIIVLISKFKLLRVYTFFIGILIIFLITIFNSGIKERNIDKTLMQLGIFNDESLDIDDSLDTKENKLIFFSKQHESHYLTALNIFIDNKVFGSGPKTFRIYCSDEKYYINKLGCSSHPHNTYIQILAETGIIGLLFILSLVSYLCFKTFKHIYNKEKFFNDYQVCLIVCFILTLFPFLPTQNFFNNWINIIYYLPVGFYLHSIYSKNHIIK